MKKLFLMSTLFVAIAFLFGCGFNLEKAKETLEEEGYTVLLVTEEDLAEYQEEDDTITGALTGQKLLNNVTILTFKAAKNAKEFAEEAKDNILYKLYTIEVKGNAVIMATDDDIIEKLK